MRSVVSTTQMGQVAAYLRPQAVWNSLVSKVQDTEGNEAYFLVRLCDLPMQIVALIEVALVCRLLLRETSPKIVVELLSHIQLFLQTLDNRLVLVELFF